MVREVISVSMGGDLADQVDERAHDARMNRSEWIREVIKDHIESEPAEATA